MLRSVLRSSFTLAGSVASFDRTGFEAALLAHYPVAIAVEILSVVAGSVRVDTRLVMRSEAEAETTRGELAAASPEELSEALGVPVESVSSPVLSTEFVQAGLGIAPSSPPPVDAAESSMDMLYVGVVAGVVVIAVVLGAGACMCKRARVRHSVATLHDVQLTAPGLAAPGMRMCGAHSPATPGRRGSSIPSYQCKPTVHEYHARAPGATIQAGQFGYARQMNEVI